MMPNMNKLTINNRVGYVAYIDVDFPKEFNKEDLVKRRAILLSPQYVDTTSCIRQYTFLNSKGKRT